MGNVHLGVFYREACGGCPGREDIGECNEGGDGESDGGEVAKDILGADEGGVHGCDEGLERGLQGLVDYRDRDMGLRLRDGWGRWCEWD